VAAPEKVKVTLPAWDTTSESGLAKELQLPPINNAAESTEPVAVRPDQLPESFVEETGGKRYVYSKSTLAEAITAADKQFGNGDGGLTRAEWRIAQRNDWRMIWLWPALMAGGTLIFFWFGIRDRISPPKT